MIYTSTSPPHPYNNSSFHIWVSFRSQNPMVPWTTPPFINNKSFPFYLLSLFILFLNRVKHANHNSAHQLALSPATQTPRTYLPRGGLLTPLTPPFTATYPPFNTRHATPQLSLSLCPLRIIIYHHQLSPGFQKVKCSLVFSQQFQISILGD